MGVSITFGLYKITLVGVQYISGKQKFTYRIELLSPPPPPQPVPTPPPPNVKDFALALCSKHNVLLEQSSPEVDVDPGNVGCFGNLPPSMQPSSQLKVTINPNQSFPANYFFTLNGYFDIGDIDIAFHTKNGQGICLFGKVFGPTCCVLPRRGIDISKFPDLICCDSQWINHF